MLVVSDAWALSYEHPKPLREVVTAAARDCRLGKTLPLPTIAWGADVATSLANGNAKQTAPGSPFDRAGLSFSLYRQDQFTQQLDDYLACRTPFLRGTLGMVGMATEALSKDPGAKPVVIYQLSWSAGGDALVVKQGIRSPKDLRGKTIAVQAYGPHVDYLTTILKDAGLTVDDVRIKWVRDLLQLDDNSVSPSRAFREDSSVDAAFVIIPEALALTSGGQVGAGAEDSVRGAHILLSTKTANRIIADVYAVRADYLQQNRAKVQGFVNALLRAEEQMAQLAKSNAAAWRRALAPAADLLLDSAAAVDDAAAMVADAEMAGYRGNVSFFGDPQYPRGFEHLDKEIQSSFKALGLLRKSTPLQQAKWDYAALAKGLSDTRNVTLPRFDTAAVAQLMERRGRTQADEDGVLFSFEIYFQPNQNQFPAQSYQQAYDKAIQLASTYGGALLTVEGHSDPLGYLRQKKKGASTVVLNRLRQAAKNLSFSRANAVKDSLIAHANAQGTTLDASQFGVTGHGVSKPNTAQCTHNASGDINLNCAPRNKQEWDATRRVVFKIIQVEAESNVFQPL
ncbi:putative nitrate/sulfonate/bicarbonate ABC transporter periplasmic protein [Magnetofaba australis IT-1]|uniref:Putative nitrate/sulfonate/bicarbonate ABC transporter periplasmic protein n=1 Tax=Magnetofaba australis IT-1 TaxID=1434232 RepID=A0A1Y2K0S2_9PROT|nr:putative nitrate/sulfonate/bicarbonate ABC transporter periplasmic protein [Magnetofaba australis IT-1]